MKTQPNAPFPSMTFGFAQNLIKSRREVTLNPAQRHIDLRSRRFVESHQNYPLLDRAADSMDPWYRSGLNQVGTIEGITPAAWGSTRKQVNISVYDAPEFPFPSPADDYTAVVEWADVFITCAVVKISNVPNPKCLHFFKWAIGARGPLNQLSSAGYIDLEEQYVPPPFNFPAGFKLTGPLAQASVKRLE